MPPAASTPTPEPPEASPSPTPLSETATAPKLRLKPKLATEAPAAPATPAPSPSPEPAPEPPAPPAPPAAEAPSPSPVALEAAPAAPSETSTLPSAEEAPRPKFKVRQRSATDAPPAAGAPSPTEEAAAKRHTPPPFPVVAPPNPPAKKFPLPPPRPPHLRAPSHAEPMLTTAAPAPGKSRGSPKKTILLALLILVFIGAFAVYRLGLLPPAVTSLLTGQSTGPTPSATLNQAAAAPGAAVNKAHDAVNSRRAAEQSRADALLTGDDSVAASKPQPVAPTPNSEPPPSQVTSVAAISQLAPGVVATTSTEVGGDSASIAFRTWVANTRINGVFQGNPARALINGRTVRVGQVVEDSLGITFDGFNIDEKTIVFRDRTGATVTRKF